MKKNRNKNQFDRFKSLVLTAAVLTVTAAFLLRPQLTSEFAYIGLKTWFDHMIVTLFPMMVMITILKDTGYYRPLMQPLTQLLKPLFRLSAEGIFVIFFGFLSGFPLGAKLTCELYEGGRIDRETADYLLAFVNNIGPAYFSGFIMGSIIPPERNFPTWIPYFVMYGIPLLYGIILRHTVYRNMPGRPFASHDIHMKQGKIKRLSYATCRVHAGTKADLQNKTRKAEIREGSAVNSPTSPGLLTCLPTDTQTNPKNLMQILPAAISAGCEQITILGGYMILCNALRAPMQLLLANRPKTLLMGHCLLEISGGLTALHTEIPASPYYLLFVHALLAFGGICCFLQTASLLVRAGLSPQKYMLHKIILCSITVITCMFLYS